VTLHPQAMTRLFRCPVLVRGIINYSLRRDADCNVTPQASVDLTQNQQIYQQPV